MYTCCQHDLITKVWVFVLLLTRSYTFLLLHEMPRASDSSNNDIQLIINWIQWQGNCRSDGRVCVMIGNELITSLPLPMNWFECKPHSTFLSDRNRCTHHQQQTSMSIKNFFFCLFLTLFYSAVYRVNEPFLIAGWYHVTGTWNRLLLIFSDTNHLHQLNTLLSNEDLNVVVTTSSFAWWQQFNWELMVHREYHVIRCDLYLSSDIAKYREISPSVEPIDFISFFSS